MDLQLVGKVVLVTGASGGIGRAIAEALAREGARVALHAHTDAAAAEAWLAGRPWRGSALVLRADVRAPAELDAAFRAAEAAWGRVDACVANAGIRAATAAPLHRAEESRLREVLETNVLGSVFTARAFLASLARRGPRTDGQGASLVFVGSTAGRFGEKGHADYAASKSALEGLMRTLKNEIVDLDPYARVNLVEPGWTATHKPRSALEEPGQLARVVRTMPLRQIGRAEDVARAVAWLCSPVARHLSGQTLTLAGGMEGRVLWEPADLDEAAIRRRLAPD